MGRVCYSALDLSNGEENKGARVAGTVALVGRTNAGKSVLLNRIVGQKLAIVSPRPQTTRNRITGVYNGPEGQMVFVDTPGFHAAEGKNPLNRFMSAEADEAMNEVDAVVLVVDAVATLKRPRKSVARENARKPNPRERPHRDTASPGPDVHLIAIAKRVVALGKPVILVLNKVDDIEDKRVLLPQLAAWSEVATFDAIIPTSGLKGVGVPDLLKELAGKLPTGEPIFKDDELTDRTERFLVAEMVREQLFLRLHDELPYSVAVEVERWTEGQGDVTIEAVILVGRESQKRIVVGAGGAMVRDIGIAARKEAAELLGRPVHLKLFVKVAEDWISDREIMDRLGYR